MASKGCQVVLRSWNRREGSKMSREVWRQGSRFPEALQDEKSHGKTIYLWVLGEMNETDL